MKKKEYAWEIHRSDDDSIVEKFETSSCWGRLAQARLITRMKSIAADINISVYVLAIPRPMRVYPDGDLAYGYR